MESVDSVQIKRLEVIDDNGRVVGVFGSSEGEVFLRLTAEGRELHLKPGEALLSYCSQEPGPNPSYWMSLLTHGLGAQIELHRSYLHYEPTKVLVGVSQSRDEDSPEWLSSFSPSYSKKGSPRGVVIGATPDGSTIRGEEPHDFIYGRGAEINVLEIARSTAKHHLLLHPLWARLGAFLFTLLSGYVFILLNSPRPDWNLFGVLSGLALANCLLGLGFLIAMRRPKGRN